MPAEEAIETLNAADEVGIIEKGGGGAQQVLPMQVVDDRQQRRQLAAARKLRFEDLQFFHALDETASRVCSPWRPVNVTRSSSQMAI